MRILFLTDHLRHSVENSFYGIANGFLADHRVSGVAFASRGRENNNSFFQGKDMEKVNTVSFRTPLTFPLSKKIWHEAVPTLIEEFDYIFLRLPWPIDTSFFTRLIEVFPASRIVNRPSGILKTSDKAFLANFIKWTPPLMLCQNLDDIVTFKSRFDCVLKPRFDYGGRGIIKIQGDRVFSEKDEHSFSEFAEIYQQAPQSFLAMKFLKNVTLGDKRIVVANGRILSTSLRKPAPGSWICNVSRGGEAEVVDPVQEERDMIEAVFPHLKKEGIFLAGFDTLVNDDGVRRLSEINTLSVGGISPAAKISGLPIHHWVVEEFFKYIDFQR